MDKEGCIRFRAQGSGAMLKNPKVAEVLGNLLMKYCSRGIIGIE